MVKNGIFSEIFIDTFTFGCHLATGKKIYIISSILSNVIEF